MTGLDPAVEVVPAPNARHVCMLETACGPTTTIMETLSVPAVLSGARIPAVLLALLATTRYQVAPVRMGHRTQVRRIATATEPKGGMLSCRPTAKQIRWR